jgi:hypothetical protein
MIFYSVTDRLMRIRAIKAFGDPEMTMSASSWSEGVKAGAPRPS